MNLHSTDWDLAELWHATREDGFTWKEQGPAITRAPRGRHGSRSVTTPDVLAWKNRYYLFFQAFDEVPGRNGDRAAVTLAAPLHPADLLGRAGPRPQKRLYDRRQAVTERLKADYLAEEERKGIKIKTD